ncbi:hypothetical protein J6590_023875 [Homalodisca vitripennis]|nr:hypothetical protein J6590_023875 [Homalodisca vitripennis]
MYLGNYDEDDFLRFSVGFFIQRRLQRPKDLVRPFWFLLFSFKLGRLQFLQSSFVSAVSRSEWVRCGLLRLRYISTHDGLGIDVYKGEGDHLFDKGERYYNLNNVLKIFDALCVIETVLISGISAVHGLPRGQVRGRSLRLVCLGSNDGIGEHTLETEPRVTLPSVNSRLGLIKSPQKLLILPGYELCQLACYTVVYMTRILCTC